MFKQKNAYKYISCSRSPKLRSFIVTIYFCSSCRYLSLSKSNTSLLN
uniref:Uncharacterized protein n=1 Tax=Rhizophora mucronata TaxID=61149 RepID=A0A2P2QLK2_RHIMU